MLTEPQAHVLLPCIWKRVQPRQLSCGRPTAALPCTHQEPLQSHREKLRQTIRRVALAPHLFSGVPCSSLTPAVKPIPAAPIRFSATAHSLLFSAIPNTYNVRKNCCNGSHFNGFGAFFHLMGFVWSSGIFSPWVEKMKKVKRFKLIIWKVKNIQVYWYFSWFL